MKHKKILISALILAAMQANAQEAVVTSKSNDARTNINVNCAVAQIVYNTNTATIVSAILVSAYIIDNQIFTCKLPNRVV